MILFEEGKCLGEKTLKYPGLDHPYHYYMILEKKEKEKEERTKVGKSYIDLYNNGVR